MTAPSIGRIVQYTLDQDDAEQINRRRQDALQHSVGSDTGFQLHFGNPAHPGQVFPMLIVTVSAPAGQLVAVNGQVFLDGNDVLWALSAVEGTEPGQWQWPPRVGG